MSRTKHKLLSRLRHDSGAAVRWAPLYKNPWRLPLTNHERRRHPLFIFLTLFLLVFVAEASDDNPERFLDKLNEQSIAAVFNKVAYGSTTKRSIPDNAYLYTTLATPLLTTYRYSDGNQEWYRVDVKEPEPPDDKDKVKEDKEEEIPQIGERELDKGRDKDIERDNYGSDLEKDHVLPTSAPAADILKNNNNKNYNNPNRYNNDRLRPDLPPPFSLPSTPAPVSTSTSYSILRNVRPTKSMFTGPGPNPAQPGREPPSYVPPSRSFFTPPLPPEYLNPFADKPTLRGTNSESYQNRRPIPPPSLMPKKDRIPFRPDLPPSVNNEPISNFPPPSGTREVINPQFSNSQPPSPNSNPNSGTSNSETGRKKTLNTPSQNVHLDRLGEFYGLNRLHNETNFEYEPMVLIPSISRILSGSNGRKEDIPDILLRTVTAVPPQVRPEGPKNHEGPRIRQEGPKIRQEPPESPQIPQEEEEKLEKLEETIAAASVPKSSDFNERNKKVPPEESYKNIGDLTTPGDILNLPNVKIKPKNEILNTTKANNAREIWHICWNVHVYLVVFLYVLLAIFSIVKLIKFERESHMFSKSYFLAVHLLLTAVCTMRIFYLAYDPYNISGSFGNFIYELLHNLPLSLLATTFAILIVFLLKRTLNHLKVKTRPVFLVLFGLGHIFLCFCLNLAENFELFGRSSFLSLICRFVYILLCWSLGLSYVYLYKIIKNVLAKKAQNLSEICTQNISYASHITIAIALLFTLLGFVQLYGLFFIKIDRFTVPYHWILWGWELSIRLLEISIITLLAIVVSLKLSQREKQNVGFPLFPCTTSDSSTDNIYPNNCSTNLNALNYSLRSQNQNYRPQNQDLSLDNIPSDIIERPNLLIDKKSTLERPQPDIPQSESRNSAPQSFERFERPNWAIERDSFPIRNFERSEDALPQVGPFERSSGRFPSGHFSQEGSGRLKPYEKCRYYAKPKYDEMMYNSSSGGTAPDDEGPPKLLKRDRERDRHGDGDSSSNVYSEPLDLHPTTSSSSDYERSRLSDHGDFAPRGPDRSSSRQSWTNSGRRSTGRSSRSKHARGAHHTPGVHTLPAGAQQDVPGSMLVDENGFVRFRGMNEHEQQKRRNRYQEPHYSDA